MNSLLITRNGALYAQNIAPITFEQEKECALLFLERQLRHKLKQYDVVINRHDDELKAGVTTTLSKKEVSNVLKQRVCLYKQYDDMKQRIHDAVSRKDLKDVTWGD